MTDQVSVPRGQGVKLHNGICLGLCAEPEGKMPFIAFRVSCAMAGAAPMSNMAGGGMPGPQAGPGPAGMAAMGPQGAGPFMLVCALSLSRDVCAMPPPAKTAALNSDTTTIGRQHQIGFFEGLLGEDSKFLTCISRAHLEIVAAPGTPGIFLVRNLSSNPVRLGQCPKPLNRGEQASAGVNESIDFLMAAPGSNQPQCFLRLVIAAGQGGFQTSGAGGQASAQHHPSDQQQLQQQQQQAGDNPAPLAPLNTAALRGAGFWLELGGSAVNSQLPLQMRRVAAVAGSSRDGKRPGVTVGRAWQQELHRAAMADNVLSWVSREHFMVEESEPQGSRFSIPFFSSTPTATYTLIAMSSNPLWRRRGFDLTKLGKQEEIELEMGDEIIFYTGATDGSPDGDGSQGTIFWKLCAA
eukprot:TRINITY_DN11003_c2_g1_i1.p1 TRINITY_DN11003_c2_g1~~TRINITY_DN11003_c2_g1_i1.p1  ORF type:complete len:447 (+),score=96.75 TRINITY_DN11003_c2_g1_i1:115-1341(+)